MNFLPKNQKGLAPLLLLLAAGGLIVLLALLSFAPFKDSRISSLYPKSNSMAASDNSQLIGLIQDVTTAAGYKYDAKDSAGIGMDSVKIIENPAGGYLAVYHHPIAGVQQTRLATSTDLLNWTFKLTIEPSSSQAAIKALPNGAFLVAFEKHTEGTQYCGGNGGCNMFKYYPDLNALYANTPSRTFAANRTLSNCNEGTPNIYSVSLNPDIDHSVIDVGFHYHRNCDVDREARATLTNFNSWSAVVETSLNTKFESLGNIGGNVGDRDDFTYNNNPYLIIEGQYTKNDFGSWRSYLYDAQSGVLSLLNIKTHKGSTAYGNPSFTNLKLPNGKQGFVSGEFFFSEGAQPGEGGSLIYFKEYPVSASPSPSLQPSSSPSPSPTPSPSASAVPAGIDLVVTDVSWTPVNPTAGTPVTFSATVKNQGSAPTPVGTIIGVLFRVNDVAMNWSDTYTSSLAPGASVTLTANGGPNGNSPTWIAAAGTNIILAHVDDVNRMVESNENNNTMTKNLVISGVSPSPSPTPAPSMKPGDIDGNNKVDIFDYNLLLTNFGKTGVGIQGDLDSNNKVDIFDYNILLTNFGH